MIKYYILGENPENGKEYLVSGPYDKSMEALDEIEDIEFYEREGWNYYAAYLTEEEVKKFDKK